MAAIFNHSHKYPKINHSLWPVVDIVLFFQSQMVSNKMCCELVYVL